MSLAAPNDSSLVSLCGFSLENLVFAWTEAAEAGKSLELKLIDASKADSMKILGNHLENHQMLGTAVIKSHFDKMAKNTNSPFNRATRRD